MRATVVLVALVLTLLTAVPAGADHNSRVPPPADGIPAPSWPPDPRPHGSPSDPRQDRSLSPSDPRPDSSLDVELKVGLKGFRFGSRLFDRNGYAGGAWLNGETGPRGLSLDGRLEHDGKAHNFKIDVDIDEALRGAARWLGLTDL